MADKELEQTIDVVNATFKLSIEKYASVIALNKNISIEKAKKIAMTTHEIIMAKLNESYSLKGKYPIPEINLLNEKRKIGFYGWKTKVLYTVLCQCLGDTMGYRNGDWEFNKKMGTDAPIEMINEMIYEFIYLGGISDIDMKNLLVSDDTIMYFSTFNVLTKLADKYGNEFFSNRRSDRMKLLDEFGQSLKDAFINDLPKLKTRDIGNTTERSLYTQKNIPWNKLGYNSLDIGSGTTMRTGCIGIFFCGQQNINLLIAYSIEASRITHNSAVAMLGGFTVAYFTSLALLNTKIEEWPRMLMDILQSDMIDDYIKSSRPNEYKSFVKDKVIYVTRWETYISKRFTSRMSLIENITIKHPIQRFRFFADNISKGHSYVGGGADDSIIMAYDSLLLSGDNLEKLITYSILHIGDSDTVGSIAFSLYGALYGYVEKNFLLLQRMFKDLEYYNEIKSSIQRNDMIIINLFITDVYTHELIETLSKHR